VELKSPNKPNIYSGQRSRRHCNDLSSCRNYEPSTQVSIIIVISSTEELFTYSRFGSRELASEDRRSHHRRVNNQIGNRSPSEYFRRLLANQNTSLPRACQHQPCHGLTSTIKHLGESLLYPPFLDPTGTSFIFLYDLCLLIPLGQSEPTASTPRDATSSYGGQSTRQHSTRKVTFTTPQESMNDPPSLPSASHWTKVELDLLNAEYNRNDESKFIFNDQVIPDELQQRIACLQLY
jgi:hypothetical protein